jgi:hypothetical protein
MKDTDHSDDWRTLCELATKENDPQKLLDLITKINQALKECHRQSQRDEMALKTDIVLLLRQDDLDMSFVRCCRLAPAYDC